MDADHSDDEPPSGGDAARPRRAFSLLLIAALAVSKLYAAVVAETVQATIAPSLYTLGLGAFAVSILGPQQTRVLAFFAGAALCLAAIGYEVRL